MQAPGERVKSQLGKVRIMPLKPVKTGGSTRLELSIEADPYDVAAWEARLREAIQVTWGEALD